MEQVKATLKYLLKAYFGGCVGCLGALSTVAALILGFAVVLGPQLGGALQQAPVMLAPLLSGPAGAAGGPPTGLPGGPGATMPTPAPTPTGTLPRLEVWLTKENRPDAPAIAMFRAGETTKGYIWARGPKGTTVSFDLWMAAPNGSKERFGPAGVFRTDPGGGPVSCGEVAGPPPVKGIYTLEAVIGTTSVGSTTFTVQ